MFWILYAFFCVILRRLNFIWQSFGTLCSIFIPILLWRRNRQSVPKRRHIIFRDAGELPRRKYITRRFNIWHLSYDRFIQITKAPTNSTNSWIKEALLHVSAIICIHIHLSTKTLILAQRYTAVSVLNVKCIIPVRYSNINPYRTNVENRVSS